VGSAAPNPPVSGTSTSAYNEHGELATETDARNVVTTRTTDALDRVTAVSYSDVSLSTIYTYDTGAFGKGRLAGIITRHGETLAYTHDRRHHAEDWRLLLVVPITKGSSIR
jgi:hypothetical protein